MKIYLFILVSSLFLSCSQNTLPISTTYNLYTDYKRPSTLPQIDSIYKDVDLVNLDNNTFEFGLIDDNILYVGNLDLKFNSTVLNEAAAILFPGKLLMPGPKIESPFESRSSYIKTSDSTKVFFVVSKHREPGVLSLIFEGDDLEAGKNLISSVLFDGIPYLRVNSTTFDSVTVIDKKIPSHDTFRWMGVNNLAAYPNGQMNWWLFSSIEKATEKKNGHIEYVQKNADKVLAKDTLNVKFLGVETTAILLKTKGPVRFGIGGQFLLAMQGKSNIPLNIYFVSATINGKNVYWVGSYFDGQEKPNSFSPLLNQIMSKVN